MKRAVMILYCTKFLMRKELKINIINVTPCKNNYDVVYEQILLGLTRWKVGPQVQMNEFILFLHD